MRHYVGKHAQGSPPSQAHLGRGSSQTPRKPAKHAPDFGSKLILAVPNGFFMFFEPPAWGWFLSSTVVLLITSWSLHNVIAWMKNKPFLGRRGTIIYIGSVLLVQPYWVLEIYSNFAYFNGIDTHLFTMTRPYEAVFRYVKH